MPTSPGKPGVLLFSKEYDKWLLYNRHDWTLDTYKGYRSIGERIKLYQKEAKVKLTIPMDKQQYMQMYLFFREKKKLGYNTMARYSRAIRAVIRHVDKSYDYSFLKTAEKPPVVFSLTQEELQKWIDLPITNWREKIKDLFLLQCLTGMRYSDTQQDLRLLISNDVLVYTSQKTKIRTTVPLRPLAIQVIQKYDGWIKVTNQVFNRELKWIAKKYKFSRVVNKKPFHKEISSHVGRKTFISLSIRQQIPLTYVMRMAGITNPKTIQRYDSANEEYLVEAMSNWFI